MSFFLESKKLVVDDSFLGCQKQDWVLQTVLFLLEQNWKPSMLQPIILKTCYSDYIFKTLSLWKGETIWYFSFDQKQNLFVVSHRPLVFTLIFWKLKWLVISIAFGYSIKENSYQQSLQVNQLPQKFLSSFLKTFFSEMDLFSSLFELLIKFFISVFNFSGLFVIVSIAET